MSGSGADVNLGYLYFDYFANKGKMTMGNDQSFNIKASIEKLNDYLVELGNNLKETSPGNPTYDELRQKMAVYGAKIKELNGKLDLIKMELPSVEQAKSIAASNIPTAIQSSLSKSYQAMGLA